MPFDAPRETTPYDRLMLAADFVETIPPETFDMGVWWVDASPAFDAYEGRQARGCAIGHMIRANLFPGQLTETFSSAQRLFGLTEHQSVILFTGCRALTPYEVAVGRALTPYEMAVRMRMIAKENAHAL